MFTPIDTGAHYAECKGRIAIDETDEAPLLHELARLAHVRETHIAVGFTLGVRRPRRPKSGWSLDLTVFAASRATVGDGQDALARYAKQHEHVPVVPFEATVTQAQLIALFCQHVEYVGAALTTNATGTTPMAKKVVISRPARKRVQKRRARR